MGQRLNQQKSSGLSWRMLKVWGLAFLGAGIAGQAILQNKILGIGHISTTQLLELMQTDQNIMLFATLALVLQTLQTCAVPIFAFLLAERFRTAEKTLSYIGWLLAAAVISQIPYNLAMGEQLLHMGTLNAMFTLALCAVMLQFYRIFPAGSLKHRFIQILITVSAVLWTLMLRMEFGPCAVLLTAVIHGLGHKPLARNLVGAVVAIVTSIFSPFFVASPMGFLAVHLYNGETEAFTPKSLAAYPCLLLAIVFISRLI